MKRSHVVLGKYVLFVLILVLGLYHCSRYPGSSVQTEGFGGTDSCPNILMQKGDRLYLYNSRKASVPGVNPIQFENLEDYTEFIEWQRANGIRCPVLFMRETNDVQGGTSFAVHPDPLNQHGGSPPIPPTNTGHLTDASRESPIFNTNSYPGYDPANQYIGRTTPLDAMDGEIGEVGSNLSGNPMDWNWGGNDFTNQLIDAGVYSGNTRPV
jgi:hypothetical protein